MSRCHLALNLRAHGMQNGESTSSARHTFQDPEPSAAKVLSSHDAPPTVLASLTLPTPCHNPDPRRGRLNQTCLPHAC